VNCSFCATPGNLVPSNAAPNWGEAAGIDKLETGEVFTFDVETEQFEPMGGKSETGITATELPRITTTLSL